MKRQPAGETTGFRDQGFTLVEVLIASLVLCIALLTAVQFLGFCILLHQRTTEYWNQTLQKWDRSREIREGSDATGVPAFPVEAIPGLYRVEIGLENEGPTWEILIDQNER